MNINYEEFHRWTLSEELKNPALGPGLAAARLYASMHAIKDTSELLRGALGNSAQAAQNNFHGYGAGFLMQNSQKNNYLAHIQQYHGFSRML